MKTKKLFKILLLTSMIVLAIFVTACNLGSNKPSSSSSDPSSSSSSDSSSDSSSSSSPIEDQRSIVLNKAILAMDLLDETTLVATLENLSYDVVWNSSDPTVATVSEDGTVRSLKAGTTIITATCGEYSASCSVTVAANSNPILTVDGTDEPIYILTGATHTIEPAFAYNGHALDDATYTFATNSEGLTVSEEGVVSCISAGDATVTVTASWGTFTEYAVVKFNMVSDSSVTCDVAKITLYSSTITGEIASTILNVTVKVDGIIIESPELSYEYDETLVSVSAEGEVTNISAETKETEVKIIYDDMYTVVKVNLVYVEVDKTDEYNDYRIVATQDNLASLFANCFDDGSQVIKVFDSADKTTNLMAEDGKLGFGADQFGERVWSVYGDKGYACQVKGLLVSAEISTAEQFKQYFVTVNGNASNSTTASDTYNGGYFELTANIDLGGAYLCNKYPSYNSGSYPVPAEGAGFNGVLDGKGYTISNFVVFTNGSSLFGTIGTNGVIKNVALVAKAACRWANGVLASSIYGTVENVFIAIDNSNFSDFYGNNFGALAYASGGDAIISNVVTYMGGFVQNDYSANTNAFLNWPYGGTMTNCYAVYGANVKTNTVDGLTSISIADYQSAEYDYTGYDASIWDLSGLPVMKSALGVLASTINTDAGDVVEYNDTIRITSEKNYNYYAITADKGTLEWTNAAYTLVPGDDLAGGSIKLTLTLFGRETDTCTINIARKNVIQTLDGTATYNQYNWSESAYVANTEALTIDTGVATINSATFSMTNAAGGTRTIDATVSDGVVTIAADVLQAIPGSEYTLNILVSTDAEDIKYTKKFDLVTKEISSRAEFKSIFLMDGGNSHESSEASETYYDGLYRLTANINLGGDWSRNKVANFVGTDTGVADFGFNGIFDGQGYTISNVTIYGNGANIFGTIGRNGVVKNTAFEASGSNWLTGVVADRVYGTIKDVRVVANISGSWTYTNNFGALAGIACPGAMIENVVTSCTLAKDTTYSVNASAFLRFDNGATIKNCYAVYGNGEVETTVDGQLNVTHVVGNKNVSDYESTQLVAITPSTLAETTFTGLDESIWDVTEGNLPTFKKASN